MSLLQLTALIFVFNALTFGNGPVMIPLLQQSLVDEARVLSLDQLLYAFAISRVIPGQANSYVGSIGYMLYGLPGALLTTAAIQLPGYAMLLVQRGYERLRASPAMAGFTRGLAGASVGLVFSSTLSIGRNTLTDLIPWAVFLLAVGLSMRFKWHPTVILAIASVFGVALRLAF